MEHLHGLPENGLLQIAGCVVIISPFTCIMVRLLTNAATLRRIESPRLLNKVFKIHFLIHHSLLLVAVCHCFGRQFREAAN